MTRYSCLLASLAVHLLLHVGHATPAADLEPCAPGSGRPKPPAAPPPPAATAPSVTAASNLLAWYQFDTTPADQATLVNHGTGGATFDATIHMQTGALQFINDVTMGKTYYWPDDSVYGNYVSIPGAIISNLDDIGHTIAFWMQDNQVDDKDFSILSGPSSDFGTVGVFIRILASWSNNVAYYDNCDGLDNQVRTSASTANLAMTPHHLAFTRENIDANTMKLSIYKDGVNLNSEIVSRTDFTQASVNSVFYIGSDLDTNFYFRDKSLGDFRIYDRALTAEEIAAIYAGDLGSAEASIAESSAAPVSTACEACTPGFFSPNGTTCEPCAPGSFSTHYNATSCDNCNATSTSFRGTSSCFDTAAHLAATGCLCGV